MAAATEPVDPATDPYLNGVFAPVDDGLDVADLPISERFPRICAAVVKLPRRVPLGLHGNLVSG
jgi:hypothetical protein